MPCPRDSCAKKSHAADPLAPAQDRVRKSRLAKNRAAPLGISQHVHSVTSRHARLATNLCDRLPTSRHVRLVTNPCAHLEINPRVRLAIRLPDRSVTVPPQNRLRASQPANPVYAQRVPRPASLLLDRNVRRSIGRRRVNKQDVFEIKNALKIQGVPLKIYLEIYSKDVIPIANCLHLIETLVPVNEAFNSIVKMSDRPVLKLPHKILHVCTCVRHIAGLKRQHFGLCLDTQG